MPSIFPELFAFEQIAPFLLRVILAFVFLGNGYSKIFINRNKVAKFFDSAKIRPGIFWVYFVGTIEIASGIMLLLGFLTQLAAFLVAIIVIVAVMIKTKKKERFLNGYDFDLLILAAALGLLLLGPGILSFDLPL